MDFLTCNKEEEDVSDSSEGIQIDGTKNKDTDLNREEGPKHGRQAFQRKQVHTDCHP